MVSKISKLAGWQSVISGLKTDSKSVPGTRLHGGGYSVGLIVTRRAKHEQVPGIAAAA